MNACDHPWGIEGVYSTAMCKACGAPMEECPRCEGNGDGCALCSETGWVEVYFTDRDGERLDNDEVEILFGLIVGEWRHTTMIGRGDGPEHEEVLKRLVERRWIERGELEEADSYRITPAGRETVEDSAWHPVSATAPAHPTDRSESDADQ